MKIFMFGTGNTAESILNRIPEIPKNIEIIGFVDNDSDKWGGNFWGKPIYSPQRMREVEFEKVIIMSDIYLDIIKESLIYWYDVDPKKIKNKRYLLKEILLEKYKDSEDVEIQEIVKYWNANEISVYNQFVKKGVERHEVQWDCIENMPYIIYEDKRMYFPFDYEFVEYNGKKVVVDLTADQQVMSPHRYIKDNVEIKSGDIIVDAGVQEGNFSLKYIEKVSKAYLFECDKRWIRPLQKTFEKFRDKVNLCFGVLGQFHGGNYVNLDNTIDGEVNFLKMDIEGAEIGALLGGRNVLLNNQMQCAICSYHKSGDEKAIKDILGYYGYETETSNGYMAFYYDENIYSTLDLRRGIVYGEKGIV